MRIQDGNISMILYSRGTWDQVPTKYISSGEFFGSIHAMQKVDRASLTKESKFFWLKLISCDNNIFPVTRIDFLWPELLSFNKNIFISCDVFIENKDYLFSSKSLLITRKILLLIGILRQHAASLNHFVCMYVCMLRACVEKK